MKSLRLSSFVTMSLQKTNEPKHEFMKPLFNWINFNIIKITFQLSTQCFRTPTSTMLKKNQSSPFPYLNIKRRNEPVATYDVYYDTSETYYGSKCAKVFVDTKTLVFDFYRMSCYKQLVKSL